MDSSLVSLMSVFVSEQFLRQCTASCIFEWVPIPRHIKCNEGDIGRGVFEVMRSKHKYEGYVAPDCKAGAFDHNNVIL